MSDYFEYENKLSECKDMFLMAKINKEESPLGKLCVKKGERVFETLGKEEQNKIREYCNMIS